MRERAKRRRDVGNKWELRREVEDSERGQRSRRKRGEKRLRSPLQWVFFFPIKESVHAKRKLDDNSSNRGKITCRSRKTQSFSRHQRQQKAIWKVDDHHMSPPCSYYCYNSQRIEVHFIHVFFTLFLNSRVKPLFPKANCRRYFEGKSSYIWFIFVSFKLEVRHIHSKWITTSD